MGDPCDLPSSCRSNTLSGQGGIFSYGCAYLPPATRFQINSYDLSLESLGGGGSTGDYNVYLDQPRLFLLEFTVQRTLPSRILSINNKTTNVDYSISLDRNENAIIIKKKDGLTWRIGSFTSFTSCLVMEGYQICNSLVILPLTRPPEGAGVFTFNCAFLSAPSQFGFSTYDLIITYSSNEQYGVRLIPVGINGVSVLAGTFTYTILGNEFTSITSSAGYTLAIKNNSLVIYANTNKSPVWVVASASSGLNNIFTALINVPPNPNFSSGLPTEQPVVTLPGCPTLFGNVWGTPDQEEICESRFVVTFFNTDCPGCSTEKTCKCWTEQSKEYVFYSTKVGAVLKGTGCTLGAKVHFLQKQGAEITVAAPATYGMLRLMLSLILFKRFDLNFLRQEYYPLFLNKLKSSNFCAYEPLFRGSNYWRFFKK